MLLYYYLTVMALAENTKSKYLSSAVLMMATSVIVKIIGAVYKIPLTAFIGAVGRGYFATAYNLYMPLHVIVMGALPIALSRLVSKHHATGQLTSLASLRKGAMSAFFAVGILGTVIIWLAAVPYARLVASSPKSVYTILVLAPCLLFSCVAACYRGYYEGFLNMVPTAVSQALEAVCKLLFGLAAAKWSMAYCLLQWQRTGALFGTSLASESEALSFIYPLTSAAAMVGVTFGTFVSMLYVIVYDRLHDDRRLCGGDRREGAKELWRFSFPIMVSCAVQSVFQFLDTATVQLALGHTNPEAVRRVYAESLQLVPVAEGDITTYVYGLFSAALDFKNLIPGITMALGVCAVPAVCREFERGEHQRLSQLINAVYRYTMLLAVGGGALMVLVAKPLLSMFYQQSDPDIVAGCTPLVRAFAVTVPVYSLASTAVFLVQALGKPERSVLPYVLSGVVRIALNMALITNNSLLLSGAVIAGAAGYSVMALLNMIIVVRLSGARPELLSVLVKPVLAGLISYFSTWYTVSAFFNSKSNIAYLLIEGVVFSAFFCILCMVLRLVRPKEIISAFQRKKMA